MLAPTISKWGLNREEWVTLLRVRAGPESPEGNLRELTGDSNLNCGIARERDRDRDRDRDRERELTLEKH